MIRWLNRHWNARKTSAAERALRRQLEERDSEIERLRDTVSRLDEQIQKLEVDKRVMQEAIEQQSAVIARDRARVQAEADAFANHANEDTRRLRTAG